MTRLVFLLVALAATPARAVTPAAEEFMAIVAKLEPVLCEKRKLRRDLLIAQTGHDDKRVAELRARYADIERRPETAKLEERLGELQKRITGADGRIRDPDDFAAITAQQREAYARCQ
jgi:hypothetical protein